MSAVLSVEPSTTTITSLSSGVFRQRRVRRQCAGLVVRADYAREDASAHPYLPGVLASCKNLFEGVLDWLWRDAESVKPGHPRRGDSVDLHELHLIAAQR